MKHGLMNWRGGGGQRLSEQREKTASEKWFANPQKQTHTHTHSSQFICAQWVSDYFALGKARLGNAYTPKAHIAKTHMNANKQGQHDTQHAHKGPVVEALVKGPRLCMCR